MLSIEAAEERTGVKILNPNKVLTKLLVLLWQIKARNI